MFLKVGHFTLDNAANNGTMMKSLERMLRKCDVAFDAVDRKIMCFAHIVDLCSKRVADYGNDFLLPDDETAASSPVARGRNVVWVIRASGERRREFDVEIAKGNAKGLFKIKPLQLLRDVCTRYLMLQRLREMRPVRLYFC